MKMGVFLAVCLLVCSGTLFAADAPAPLAPEVEERLAEFLKSARAAKREVWATQSRQMIEDFAKTAGVPQDRVRALNMPTDEAIERSLDEWAATARDGWRKWAEQVSVQGLEVFDQVLGQVGEYVRSDYFADFRRPLEQPQWLAALRATFPPEQAATWERMEKERQEAVLKEIAEPFKAAAERTREMLRANLKKKGAGIRSALNLPEDRAAKFDELADTIVNGAPEVWRARSTRNFLWMDEAHRRTMLQSNFHIHPDDKETARMEADWDAGVAKLLTPQEVNRLRVTLDEYKERRTTALAGILITQLDEQVSFTASQRERLRPLVDREVSADPSVMPDPVQEGYFQIDVRKLFGCVRKVKDEELRAVLDETQRKRWQEACNPKSQTTRARMLAFGGVRVFGGMAIVQPATPQKSEPKRAGEPEDVENAFSDHFHEQAATERKRLLAIHLLKAEDAARVAGLSEQAMSVLATAARGVAEEELATWKSNTEQTIRSQMRDVTPETVKQRLAGIERYSYGRRSGGTNAAAELWDAALKSALTEEQQAVWRKEIDARAAFREAAIASLVTAEFDRRISLTNEQYDKLSARVAAMVKEYTPDIESMFSYAYGSAWYLQSHSMFLPVAAIGELEMKAVLTKEQWTRWSGSAEFGNVSNYWENVQRIHANRVREKTP